MEDTSLDGFDLYSIAYSCLFVSFPPTFVGVLPSKDEIPGTCPETSNTAVIGNRNSVYFDADELDELYTTLQEVEEHDAKLKLKTSLTCKSCNKEFANKLSLSRHSRRHHFSVQVIKNPKSFWEQCPKCNKIFVDKRSFMDHQNGHEDKKPFACGSCGKTFTLKRNLARHVNTHAIGDDKENLKLSCNVCGKSFFDPSSFKRHEKKVHRKVK